MNRSIATRQVLVLLALSGALLPDTARAGVRPYALLQGIDSLGEGDLELESWFSARRKAPGNTSWDWWFGPVVGLSDQLEAGLFAIFAQSPSKGEAPGVLQLSSLRLQLSYQLAPKGAWPVDVRVRGELGQPIAAKGTTVWTSVIVSWDQGPVNVSANAGFWVKKEEDVLDKYIDYGVGASVEALTGLRVGAELMGMEAIDQMSILSLGPSIGYASGRLWVSSHVGAALTTESPSVRGRLVLGLLSSRLLSLAVLCLSLGASTLSFAQTRARSGGRTIQGKVAFASLSVGSRTRDLKEVLIFVEGLTSPIPQPKQPLQIEQKNRAFEPRVLIVPIGSTVSFPNRDEELHNVFSLTPASMFDLSLYERGMSKDVAFEKPGIVSVFCNIHPQMRAHLIVVSNPFYTYADSSGRFELRGLPPGTYTIAAWHPLGKIAREEVRVEADGPAEVSLVVRELRLPDEHRNKHGKPYGSY